MENEERLARMGLSWLRGRGEQLSQEELRSDPIAYWQQLAMRSDKAAGIEPERLQDDAAAAGIRFIVPGDAEWPTEFDQMDELGSPFDEDIIGLWVTGASLSSHHRPVALLSSEVATVDSESVIEELARRISRAGRSIVTSGAADVDVAALRGARRARGPVVAVLPTAIDQIGNKRFVRELSGQLEDEQMTAITEAPPGCNVYSRSAAGIYRMILALAEAFVAIDIFSGSDAQDMVVAAHRLGHQTFAVPGSINHLISRGANELIRDRHASMLLDADTISRQLS